MLRVIRVVFLLVVVAVVYAPGAYACSTCNLQDARTTLNGVTYNYKLGGCATPAANSWGSEDCHTTYYVFAGSIQGVLECDTSGFGCYYTEVNGGGGGGGGDVGNLSDGSYDSGSGGFCSAEYASCH